jgi:hypothetical protein
MYRIEVAPGEETVFRTIEELAVAIRNGVVTPRSRIYHNASQKWLPIGLHPHYKKAMELPAASAAHQAPATPAPSAPRTRLRPETHAPTSAPEAKPAPKVPAPVVSPIVAMQQEVLRDLPVVSVPEPLPWTKHAAPAAPAPAPASIARIAQAVQAQPPAQVTFAPTVLAEPQVERAAAPVRPHREEPTIDEEHAHARPTARRAPRAGGRPFLLLGAAAAIAIGAHFALATRSSATAGASEQFPPVNESPEYFEPELVEEEASQPARASTAGAAVSPPARVSSAPARVPMTPGPAFAASAPAAAGADTAAPRRPAPPPAPATSAAAAPAIEPAPVELKLTLPDLGTDSMVPVARTGDSTAMKKILRALNGSKPQETPAAP